MKKAIVAIVVGIVLLICSISLPFLFLIPLLSGGNDNQFIIPGSKEITIEEDGTYYLWNNYKTIYQGKSYSTPKDLPGGLTFSLTNTGNGQDYKINHNTSMSTSSGNKAKQTIGSYELKKGKYLLKVDGESKSRVFSFGKGVLKSIMMVMAGIFAAIIFGIVSFIIIILGIVFLIKNLIKNEKQ